MITRLKSKNINVKHIQCLQNEKIIDNNQIFNVKYDMNLFQNLQGVFIKDYGYLYDLENRVLKVKRTKINNSVMSEVRKLTYIINIYLLLFLFISFIF